MVVYPLRFHSRLPRSALSRSMTMNLNLRADNGGGWIPSKCSSIDIEVRDVTTSRKVGTGTIKNKSFPGRKKTVFQFPVNFEYSALNDTDTTYQNFYKGCGPKCECCGRRARAA